MDIGSINLIFLFFGLIKGRRFFLYWFFIAWYLETHFLSDIWKIKNEGVTETELQKIKNQKLIEFYNQVETINGKSNNIGTYEVFFGDYRKMFDAPANYNKVTVADVQRVAKKYFTKSNRTVAVLKTNVEE